MEIINFSSLTKLMLLSLSQYQRRLDTIMCAQKVGVLPQIIITLYKN